ncbi:MAG: tripartite tricarboxylate transporter TctB family protein [Peptococcaceae bacterium]
MKKHQKIIVPTIMLLWAIIYFVGIAKNPAKDQMLIKPVFLILVLLYIFNTYKELKKTGSHGYAAAKNEEIKYVKTFLLMLLGFIFLLIVELLGFILTTIIFVFLTFKLFEVRQKKVLFIGPVVLSLGLYYLFSYWLGVPLPKGILVL